MFSLLDSVGPTRFFIFWKVFLVYIVLSRLSILWQETSADRRKKNKALEFRWPEKTDRKPEDFHNFRKIVKIFSGSLKIWPYNLKALRFGNDIQWRWDIKGQKIMRQSTSDWLKMTPPHTSKSNSGDLRRFWTMKIGGKWSDELDLPELIFLLIWYNSKVLLNINTF